MSLFLGDPSTKVNLVCPSIGGTALDFLVLAAQRTAEDREHPGDVAAEQPKRQDVSWLEKERRDRTARVRTKIRERVAAKSEPKPRLGDAMAASAQQCRSSEGVGLSVIAVAVSGQPKAQSLWCSHHLTSCLTGRRRKILSALLSSGAVSHLFNSEMLEELVTYLHM